MLLVIPVINCPRLDPLLKGDEGRRERKGEREREGGMGGLLLRRLEVQDLASEVSTM